MKIYKKLLVSIDLSTIFLINLQASGASPPNSIQMHISRIFKSSEMLSKNSIKFEKIEKVAKFAIEFSKNLLVHIDFLT